MREYEVGQQPGPPTRPRVEVDPVTLRVLGGAFHAIAKEMASVLFRMSYSSIIRESEDLGVASSMRRAERSASRIPRRSTLARFHGTSAGSCTGFRVTFSMAM